MSNTQGKSSKQDNWHNIKVLPRNGSDPRTNSQQRAEDTLSTDLSGCQQVILLKLGSVPPPFHCPLGSLAWRNLIKAKHDKYLPGMLAGALGWVNRLDRMSICKEYLQNIRWWDTCIVKNIYRISRICWKLLEKAHSPGRGIWWCCCALLRFPPRSEKKLIQSWNSAVGVSEVQWDFSFTKLIQTFDLQVAKL